MLLKRSLAFLLVCILTFSLIACNKGDESTPADSNTDVTAPEDNAVEETTLEEETTAEPTPEIVKKNYKFIDILDHLKLYGRSDTTVQGLQLDNSSSGWELNAYVEGALSIVVNVTKECYFTLYVDGVRSETRIKAVAGSNKIELASFETGALHNIRLIKQTEAEEALATFLYVAFTGYFAKAPQNANTYIEFLGDSITVGYGNLIANGVDNPGAAVYQDGTKSYAYLAAQKVGADYSMVAVGGLGVIKGSREFLMKDYFAANSYYRSPTAKYEPKRIPTVVVINLGTNDAGKGVNPKQWQAGVEALIQQVRTTYETEVPIVWVYNMMDAGTTFPQALKETFDALGGEAAGLYTCKLVNNREGGKEHPNLAAHATAAEELASFLQSKNLLK